MTEFVARPEGFYRTIVINESCTGFVIKYDKELKCLFVYLGNGNIGVMPEDEASIYKYKYPMNDVSLVPYQISTIVGRKIRARIVGILDGIYILSRRAEMMESYKYFLSHTDNIITSKIVNIIEKGIFCDIGEGVIGFIPIQEISCCYVNNIRNYYSVGDGIRVKITDIKSSDDDYRITLTRKRIYSDIWSSPNAPKEGDILVGRIGCPVIEGNGYFVEITPAISGIANVPPEISNIKEGAKAVFYVKRITEKGAKLNLMEVLT